MWQKARSVSAGDGGSICRKDLLTQATNKIRNGANIEQTTPAVSEITSEFYHDVALMYKKKEPAEKKKRKKRNEIMRTRRRSWTSCQIVWVRGNWYSLWMLFLYYTPTNRLSRFSVNTRASVNRERKFNSNSRLGSRTVSLLSSFSLFVLNILLTVSQSAA